MPIPVKCQCGKAYKAPDNAAGKTLRCKSCGKGVVVPAKKNPTIPDAASRQGSGIPRWGIITGTVAGCAVLIVSGLWLFGAFSTKPDSPQKTSETKPSDKTIVARVAVSKSKPVAKTKADLKQATKKKNRLNRQLVTHDAGRFAVEMPGKPKETVTKARWLIREIPATRLDVSVADGRDFSVTMMYLGLVELDGKPIVPISDQYEEIIRSSGDVTDRRGKPRDVFLDDIPGRESTVVKENGRKELHRAFFVHGRVYHLVAGWPTEDKRMQTDAEKFIQSFEFTKAKLQWLKVSELRATTGVARFQTLDGTAIIRQYVCVCGAFPIRKQHQEFKKLKMIAGEPKREGRINDLIIERQEIEVNNKTNPRAEWKRIDLDSTIEFLKKIEFASRPLHERVATQSHIESPLPKRSDRPWGNEGSHPRLAENLAAYQQVPGWEVVMKPAIEKGERTVASDKMHRELRRRTRWHLVRFMDFFVKENHKYRYRIRIGFVSPLNGDHVLTLASDPTEYVTIKAKP